MIEEADPFNEHCRIKPPAGYTLGCYDGRSMTEWDAASAEIARLEAELDSTKQAVTG